MNETLTEIKRDKSGNGLTHAKNDKFQAVISLTKQCNKGNPW